jgi:RNA polymerase sigma factor (sigma-70 family)
MNNVQGIAFEEIYEQNKRRIHYYMNKLNIREDDNKEDFYQEGLYALWKAFEKYDPNKGTLSTYFNYAIRNRLIDMIRKSVRDHHYDEIYYRDEIVNIDHGNRYCKNLQSIPDTLTIPINDNSLWTELKSQLTDKQWKWVECFVILDMSIQEIARQEDVSIDAVKSWGRQVRRKLRGEEFKNAMEAYSID